MLAALDYLECGQRRSAAPCRSGRLRTGQVRWEQQGLDSCRRPYLRLNLVRREKPPIARSQPRHGCITP
jgi:hypothetical protein